MCCMSLRTIRQSLIIAVILLTGPEPALADDDKKKDYSPVRFVDQVKFSFMAYQQDKDTHRRLAQWQLKDVDNWQKFANTIEKLPKLDKDRDKPEWAKPGAPKSDYIRILVMTTNDFVARKIDIYDNTIRIVSRKAKNIFYKPKRGYLRDLEQKQTSYKAFPEKMRHSDPANMKNSIIVRYRRFAGLPNPVWHMDDPKDQNRLFDMLASLKSMPERDIRYARDNAQRVDTAEIYFNNIATPGNFRKLKLTPKFARGEKIDTYIHHFKDKKNYFAFFKKHARKYMQ